MSVASCCLDDGLEGEVLLDPALLPGALHDGARPHQRQPVLGVLQWQGGHQIFSYRLVSCHSIIAILEFYNFYNFTKSIDLNMFSMFDLNSSPDIDASRHNKTQRYPISIVSTIYLHTNVYIYVADMMR